MEAASNQHSRNTKDNFYCAPEAIHDCFLFHETCEKIQISFSMNLCFDGWKPNMGWKFLSASYANFFMMKARKVSNFRFEGWRVWEAREKMKKKTAVNVVVRDFRYYVLVFSMKISMITITLILFLNEHFSFLFICVFIFSRKEIKRNFFDFLLLIQLITTSKLFMHSIEPFGRWK